jgi:hypothetical protein
MPIQSSKEKNILYKSVKTNNDIKKDIKKDFENSKIRCFQKYFKNELKNISNYRYILL